MMFRRRLPIVVGILIVANGCAGRAPDPVPTPDTTVTTVPTAAPDGTLPPPVVVRGCDWHKSAGIEPGDDAPDLVAAVFQGDVPEVARLLDKGADPDAIDPWQATTALSAATQSICIEMVRLLLEAGADPNRVADGGGSPLVHAANAGNVELVKMLLAAGADPIKPGGHETGTPLEEAIGVGRMNIVQLMLRKVTSIDAGRNPESNPLAGEDIGVGSALEFAARVDGRADFVRLLLAAGATPSITSLYRAVLRGDAEVVALLLAAGAPISVSQNEKRTMVEVALDSGHPDIARLLEQRQ